MVYTSNMINTSATIVGKAASAITDPRGKAIKFDADGKMVLAGAGDECIGIAIVTNDEVIEAGQDIDVQVTAMGVGLAGAAITAGAPLASDANGKLVPASGDAAVVAYALEAATTGKLTRLILAK